MTESQTLLSKITALRQRLEQAQSVMRDADTVAAALAKKGDANAALRRKVEAGSRQQSMLETALQQLPDIARAAGDGTALPTKLTLRAARLLRRAQDLLGQLRTIASDDPASAEGETLGPIYREAASMTDAVLRTVQHFPESASAQIRLAEGLEAVLNTVADRVLTINSARRQRRHETGRRDALADILTTLAGGGVVEEQDLIPIAESVLEEMLEGGELRFSAIAMADVSQHIAGHSLTVAQIIARLSRHDSQWRAKPLEPIMAALIHDVGMLKVPSAVLQQTGPLTDGQRRQIESHAALGGEMAARIKPSSAYLVDAASQHHERMDGTGYPGGLRELQIKPLVRLMSICDTYAAMCQPRAYRPALDTRTALADTLLLAEDGCLDRNQAEFLLQLSFYPVGTVVELSDGAVGVVVATHPSRKELNLLAKPVVALLADAQGELLPMPRHLDLADVEGQSILRGLTPAERLERLGCRYPHLLNAA